MTKAILKTIDDHGTPYTALMFCCPGCAEIAGNTGLHMLAVNSPQKSPSWTWDGSFDAPTVSPSILTRYPSPEKNGVCHSFLRNGNFEYLGDCTHSMAGQHIPMPDIEDVADWLIKDEFWFGPLGYPSICDGICPDHGACRYQNAQPKNQCPLSYVDCDDKCVETGACKHIGVPATYISHEEHQMTEPRRHNIFEQQVGQPPEENLQTWVDTVDWSHEQELDYERSTRTIDGVWLVYGITTKAYPLVTCKTKLEAEQWVQMNQKGKVIFWPTGTLFEELDIQ